MAPRKSKKSKKRIRDPRLFPSAEAFQEAGNGDWSVPTGNLDDRNTSWGVAIEPEACAESPRDNWDGPSIPKSKREIEREERQEMDMRLKGWPWADGSREPVSIVSLTACYESLRREVQVTLELKPHQQAHR